MGTEMTSTDVNSGTARPRNPGREPVLNDLLASVLEAHGGLEHWDNVTELEARLSLGGPFWELRGWPEVYAGQTVTLDAHREHITFTPFTAPDRMSVLDVDPERVRIQTTDGEVVEERLSPRASSPLPFDDFKTTWDAIQVAYFTSAATWNYLTVPFVFTYAGVTAKEIEPWDEHGETRRRLAVKFPPGIANHNPDQVFYYDERLMLRRMDYSPDVTGNPRVAHYTHDPKTFDGFVFPTRRRVHLYDEAGIADQGAPPPTRRNARDPLPPPFQRRSR
jgi:hypothetical protein